LIFKSIFNTLKKLLLKMTKHGEIVMGQWQKLGSAFLLCLICIQPILATNIVETIGDGENQITVLYLKGEPYDLGYIHGCTLKEEVNALYDSLLIAAGRYASPYLLDVAYKQLEEYIPQDYKDEMQGLADGAGIDVKLVHRVHAIPDLSEIDCTFFAAWGNATADGNLVQIRALDYATDLHLQEHPAIIVYEPDDGRRFVNVGWVGFIGVVSGMNYDGICVSEIGESYDSAYHTLAAEPMPFVLRDVLQHCDNLDQAVESIQTAKRTSSFLYCVGDGKIPDARSFKAGPRFCDVFTDQTSPNPFLDNVVYFSMGVSSSWNSKVYYFLQPQHGAINTETAMNLMRQLGTGDLHSVVYGPAYNKLWVANAGIDETDAFRRNFVEFDLNRADSIFASYTTAGANLIDQATPEDFILYQNSPNPFNSQTQIKFDLNRRDIATTELSVYDLRGHLANVLVKDGLPVGRHEISWNGCDENEQPLPSGIYFYKLQNGSYQQVRRMALIR